MNVQSLRRGLADARRLVVKVGTQVLVGRDGRPDLERISTLVEQIAALRRDQQRDVVLVSSGAIGAGLEALRLNRRPKTLPGLQMAAAVGQSRLMATYDRLFGERGCTVGQILLTHDDLKHRVRHLNARNAMMQLMRSGVVPVVNENDAVSVDEIRFGDNDQLASLVSMLIDAELLVLLTTTDGFRAPISDKNRRTKRVPYLPAVTDVELQQVWTKKSELSTGGMQSKLQAAQAAADVGVNVVIADGRRADVITEILAGKDVGTLIGAADQGSAPRVRSRKRWIGYFQRTQGALLVDDGARRALCERKKSLLPAGVRQVQGRFDVGAVVSIKDPGGKAFARGLVEYSSDDIETIKGHRSSEIVKLLDGKPYDSDEVIHRDNMVVFD